MGNVELLGMEGRRIRPHLAGGVSIMYFLELQWEPGVYSRGTAGMAIQNSCLFSDVRTPV